MAAYKKSENIQGKYKSLQCVDGNIVDTETGTIINLYDEFSKYFKDQEFTLVATHKQDFDLE